ncbi:MAG: cupin domain-containing protein [Acidobacteria bacterium]|nr:MAG: cupin domain-containing protein [Acidobacteriota bacterium]
MISQKRPNTRPFRLSLASVVLLLVIAPGCTDGVHGPTEPTETTATSAEPVIREILAQMDSPPGAPGRRLTLVRYTIAPAAQLAPHIHPGVQVASIVSGTLTYEIVSGTATIHRAIGANGVPARTEALTGPARTTLGLGDAVIEEGQMVHFGSNRTTEPVVISATVITEGSDLSVSVPGTAE